MSTNNRSWSSGLLEFLPECNYLVTTATALVIQLNIGSMKLTDPIVESGQNS